MKFFGRATPVPHRPTWETYGFAVVSALVAATITSQVPVLGGIPFAMSFVAIGATAWFGSFRAGIVCTLVSAIAVDIMVFTPQFSLRLSWEHFLQTVIAVAVAVLICAVARQRELRQERLRQVENFFEITLHSIGDAVVATDESGMVTFLNECAEKLTEWTSDEANGRPLSEVLRLTNQLTGAVVENPVSKVIETGQIVGLANHTTLTSRSGKRIQIEDSAAPIRTPTGELKGVVLVFRDISRQYALEQQRADSERMLKELVESISEGFVSIDKDWKFSFVNKQAASLIGRTPQQLLGKSVWKLFPATVNTKFELTARTAAETGAVARVTEYYPPLDKWVEITAYPAKNGISILTRDVTDETRAEERMRVADRLATAGRLAAAVSHEINNPLEAVGNLIYLAKLTSKDPAVVQSLEEAERQLYRAAHIAKQTLTFYKHAGEASETSISSAVKEAVALFQSRAESRGITIVDKVTADAMVLISPGELVQVIANLVANAIDVAPAGSEIGVRAARSDAHAIIEVCDSGTGIAPDILNRIFEPFYTTKKDVGTGLGLWVAKNIVEKHGGTITAENRSGHPGAVFRVSLAVARVQEAG